jgi:ribonuclease PH
MRVDGRAQDQLREIEIETGYQPLPEGSALITWGETRVLCAATVEDRVPPFLIGKSSGWVTAEYSMLPGSGNRRVRRRMTGGAGGRTHEIQRLVGRSLRQSVNLQRLGERTVIVDCDGLVADGGTRVASITGGAVALRLAINRLIIEGKLEIDPFQRFVAAVSLGLVDGECLLDLCYHEDSNASVDMNVVATESGELVELQASAERDTVTLKKLTEMTQSAIRAITESIVSVQKSAVNE